jgi:hypothetical protein
MLEIWKNIIGSPPILSLFGIFILLCVWKIYECARYLVRDNVGLEKKCKICTLEPFAEDDDENMYGELCYTLEQEPCVPIRPFTLVFHLNGVKMEHDVSFILYQYLKEHFKDCPLILVFYVTTRFSHRIEIKEVCPFNHCSY